MHPVTIAAAPKVGYVIKRFPRLSETFILNEILELERQGVEVEIFSLLHPPEEPRHRLLESLRARVTYLPRGRALDGWKVRSESPSGGSESLRVADGLERPGALFDGLFPGRTAAEASHLCLKATTLALLASDRGTGHLHAHFGSDATTAALLAGRLSGIPYSYTAHARDIYHTYVDARVDADLRRRKMAEAAFVATVSDFNRRHLIELAGHQSAHKIHRLYNGIDLDRFRPGQGGREPDLLLAVGRLVEKKGFRDLVEACRLLAEDGRSFRCLLVGEGPERVPLERRILEAGLGDRFRLMGPKPQEELLGLMERATAIVLPCVVSESGDRDGLPTVLLEALASGLPAVSTSLGGNLEIIDHERSGLLVEPGAPRQLAAAIGRLLAEPDLRRRLAAAGRLKAERDFDLRTNVATLRNLFAGTAAGRPFHEMSAPDEDRLRHG